MNRILKWSLIAVCCLIVVIIAALFIAPKFVNVQKYKPQIEKRVAEATGRTFSVGDDLRLSLFPWAGLSFSDLNLGSLPGFEQKQFVTVKSFEVRVKLLPLLFKDVQVKRFLLKGARIVLEKNKDGRVNWDFSKKAPGEVASKMPPEKPKAPAPKAGEGFALKSLVVGDFAVTEGSLLWIDHAKGQRKEISDMTFRLKDVSLERPIHLSFAARMDDKPLSLQGSVGPLGKELGKGAIPIDLAVKAWDQFETSIKGRVIDATASPGFDLEVQVSPLSPRKLLAVLGRTFPVVTSDSKALNLVALKAKIKGNSVQVAVSDGVLDFDESKLKFSVSAREFSKPDVTFDVDLDKIDLDRYLPPPSEPEPSSGVAKGKSSGGDKKKQLSDGDKKSPSSEADKKNQSSQGGTKAEVPKPAAKKVDYTPLRKLVLNGNARIGKLKIKNARMENVHLKINAKNGIFDLDPFSLKLYQGAVSGKGALNVQKDTPATEFKLEAEGIQAGPLLNDVLKKDFLEGTLKATLSLAMSGDEAGQIKKTLDGNGDLLFKDGAVKGIDLAGMVRNVQAAFGLAEKSAQKPKTDFAEIHVPFAVKRGLTTTSNTTMLSPLLRITAAGKADLVTETLDFRVEPKFVGTLKGQGDAMERSGITVPVLVSGSFASPNFRPDLEGLFKKKIEETLPELQKSLLGGDKKKGDTKSVEEQIKGIFKGLPFGK